MRVKRKVGFLTPPYSRPFIQLTFLYLESHSSQQYTDHIAAHQCWPYKCTVQYYYSSCQQSQQYCTDIGRIPVQRDSSSTQQHRSRSAVHPHWTDRGTVRYCQNTEVHLSKEREILAKLTFGISWARIPAARHIECINKNLWLPSKQ